MSLVDAVNNFEPLAGEPSPYEDPPSGVRWDTILTLTGYDREAELAARVLARLDPWFTIEREVRGQHFTGRRLRIDAVVRPRDPNRWKNPDAALGLEFKRYTPGEFNVSVGEMTSLATQAIDYTQTEWDGYGRIHVFTCPGLMQWAGLGRRVDHVDVGALMYRHLLARFGVGELLLRWGYGLTFDLGDHPIWSERTGVRQGKHWSLKPRAGSR